VEGLVMYNYNELNATSWDVTASQILANNSMLVVAIRQLYLATLDEAKVGTNNAQACTAH
jgi:hypothetical protein